MVSLVERMLKLHKDLPEARTAHDPEENCGISEIGR